MNQKGSRAFDAAMEQVRAARALLGWSQSVLAERASLSLPTIKRFEADLRIQVSDQARQRIQEAFEAAGVVFLDENGGGLGVRFEKPRRRKQRL